ncbi:MAG: PEP-CTERM sorting domain-containing protein [Gammaproteobacteria bacterium]|jgi:hypothetical protein|nr:PEP-CTERM sorting domain-containing protein [Gammaproteobacteria bacterium]MBU0773418.1 PEP-CTERM sorting domain-containing protein [Gammaproteobacteria bacterium]MBU0857378.1 PEP-CTERM sorting domain-containing protein [Gammaproteobacteria bacterium]MBU1846841.1 PEP-CTERM sorting domain-containing protein [Gammaproteobacteria bacterium]
MRTPFLAVVTIAAALSLPAHADILTGATGSMNCSGDLRLSVTSLTVLSCTGSLSLSDVTLSDPLELRILADGDILIEHSMFMAPNILFDASGIISFDADSLVALGHDLQHSGTGISGGLDPDRVLNTDQVLNLARTASGNVALSVDSPVSNIVLAPGSLAQHAGGSLALAGGGGIVIAGSQLSPPVPEPAPALLFGAGLALLAWRRR